MGKGLFYSVGVGPGDPSLLTYKAVEAIKNSDIIAAPDSGAGENLALKIAAEHLSGKRVITYPMPMTHDAETMRASHRDAASQVGQLLDQGLTVAFLTLGDPSIYSTAMYVHRLLTEAGYQTRLIPGVPSFCAAAASLNMALVEGKEPLHIIPAAYGGEYQQLEGVKVLMKSGRGLGKIVDELRASEDQIMLVERASMADQRVFLRAADIPDTAGYFSLLVIKPAKEGENPQPEQAMTLPAKEFFPLFVSSRGQRALVVGGGQIAHRRLETLLRFSFEITVVAPKAGEHIKELAAQEKLTLLEREFQEQDLEGCFLALAATDNRMVNQQVGRLARERGLWVSVADCSKECSFFFPALAVNDKIVVGITSEGQSHQAVRQAARQIREVLR